MTRLSVNCLILSQATTSNQVKALSSGICTAHYRAVSEQPTTILQQILCRLWLLNPVTLRCNNNISRNIKDLEWRDDKSTLARLLTWITLASPAILLLVALRKSAASFRISVTWKMRSLQCDKESLSTTKIPRWKAAKQLVDYRIEFKTILLNKKAAQPLILRTLVSSEITCLFKVKGTKKWA